jgi:hypothetical protein
MIEDGAAVAYVKLHQSLLLSFWLALFRVRGGFALAASRSPAWDFGGIGCCRTQRSLPESVAKTKERPRWNPKFTAIRTSQTLRGKGQSTNRLGQRE